MEQIDTKGENIKNIKSTQPGDSAGRTDPIESINWGLSGGSCMCYNGDSSRCPIHQDEQCLTLMVRR